MTNDVKAAFKKEREAFVGILLFSNFVPISELTPNLFMSITVRGKQDIVSKNHQ